MDVTVQHVDSGRSCVVSVSEGGSVLRMKVDALKEMFPDSINTDREASVLSARIQGCEEDLNDEERVANTGLEGGGVAQLVTRCPEVMAPHVYPPQGNRPIKSIALSRCGTLCAVGDNSGKISVFDTTTAKLVAHLTHGRVAIKWSVFSFCGTWLATCSADGSICVRQTATWEQAWDLKYDATEVWSAAWTHCGRLVSGNAHGRVCVWDMEDPPNFTALNGNNGAVLGISATSTRIFTGSADTTICVYDTSTLTHTDTLNDHTTSIFHIALTEDERLLVSCADFGVLKVWCTTSLSCLRSFDLDTGIDLVAASGRGDVVAASCSSRTCLLHLTTLEPFGAVPSQGDGVALSRCGRWVFTPIRGSASVQAVCDARHGEEE